MLLLLQGGKGHNTSTLAHECGVSRRTIFRDLDVIREAGVPLLFDEERQAYFIRSTRYLPPTSFTADEALAVMVLCQQLGASQGVPFLRSAQSAALKLASALPERLRDYLHEVSGAVAIRLPQVNPLAEHHEVYDQLLDAIRRRRAVRLVYDSYTEWRHISTRLNPYRLLFSRRSWYVIGRSSLHRATRTFNLGRVVKLEVLSECYRPPRGFSLQRYLRNAWHLIPEPGPDQQVLVRFQPLVAGNVAEVLWHKTQELKLRDDGTLDFRATVSGLNEIAWWILGYGRMAEALEPAALREIVAQHAEHMAAMYAEQPKPEPRQRHVARSRRRAASPR